MYPKLRCVILAGFTALGALAAGAEVKVLTLAEALTMAQAANPTVLLSREVVQQAAELVRLQRAGILPQVNWDNTQRRARTASVGGALVRSGINNRFDSSVSGRLDLFDPQRIASYQAAKIAATAAGQTAEGIRELALADVADSYFTHLRNIDRIQVFDSNIVRARALLELALRHAEAGVATQIDVTRAEAQLATAEQARLQQETLLWASELDLKQLLAIELATTLTLEPFQVQRTEPPGHVAGQEEAAFANRADLRAAETLLRQSEMEVRAARYDRLPSLALFGSAGAATENVLDGKETKVWSGSVSMSVPIFDGQRIRALTSLAESRLRAQQVRFDDLKRRIAAEVRFALQDANSRLAQIAVAEKNQRLAEDELRLARMRYEQGVADNREVVDAQNRLAEASDNLVDAIYQYNLSRLELARARGDVRTVLQEQAP